MIQRRPAQRLTEVQVLHHRVHNLLIQSHTITL